MYKNSLKKIGLTFLVFILFIGLSVIPGYSSSVSSFKRTEAKQNIEGDLSNTQLPWMGVEDASGYPGETVIINITGEWFQTISGFSIGLHYPDGVIESITVTNTGCISEDAFVFQYVEPSPGVLSIGAAWMPGSYKPAGSGILAKIIVDVDEEAAPGNYVFDLGVFGGDPPVECAFSDEFSVRIFVDYFTDGTLTVLCFQCGDIDGSGSGPDIADLVYLVEYMFLDGDPPIPDPCIADINGDGNGPDIADLVYLVDYMFTGGPSIVDDCCG